jgi:hypothetical protein
MNTRAWGVGSGTLRASAGLRGGARRTGGWTEQGRYHSPLLTPRWGAVAVTCIVAGGCGGAAAGPNAVERDSAGIHIVENPAALAARPLWTVAPEPSVEIGLLEGDEAYQLSQVRGAVRLSDGRIVIANGGTQELRFYDSTGAHVVTAGREGEGPGEFNWLGLLVRFTGDTVAAYDWNLRRVSFFDSRGAFVRSFSLDLPGGFPSPIGTFSDGTWLSSRGFVFAPGGGSGSEIVRDTLPFLVFEPTGLLRDSIGRFPGPEWHVRSEARNAMATSLPFGRSTEAAAVGDRFYAGHNERYEVVRYTAAGVPELAIRLEHPQVQVTDADIGRHKADRLEDTDARMRPQAERNFQEMPWPATFPAFADIAVDPDGNLWVLEYNRPGDDTRRWTVFSPDGHALGYVDTPPGTRILEIGRDHVIGVWSDELDVEHVRLYSLTRGER